jgi:hypothetical protein
VPRQANPIPERVPVGDLFTGFVLQLGQKQALATAPESGMDLLAQGNFIIRYGLRYLGKLHISVVPGLVALDYGEFLTGETAWDFLINGSNLYPRSEVLGYRNDGRDEMIVIKALDLSVPPEVLVYADTSAISPIAKPTALIAPADIPLPARLLEFLPRFATLAEWQTVL